MFGSAAGSLKDTGRLPALAIVAAFIGLSIAGFNIAGARSQAPTTVPPGYAALVNGEPVLMSDYVTETENTYATPFDQTTPAQRAKVLHSMINVELAVQRALALDLPEQDSTLRTGLYDSLNAVVSATSLANRPTDAELRAFFNQHRQTYSTGGNMAVTDLVLHVGGYENTDQTTDQALADAAQAAYELRSGASLDYVISHFGFIDTHKVQGSEPDFAAKIHLGNQLYAVAERMTDGEISAPTATPDGVHLLIMQRRQPPIFSDFDSVRNNVYADYIAQQKKNAQQQNIIFLRRRATILLAPGLKE
jgi:hypothetical protein